MTRPHQVRLECGAEYPTAAELLAALDFPEVHRRAHLPAPAAHVGGPECWICWNTTESTPSDGRVSRPGKEPAMSDSPSQQQYDAARMAAGLHELATIVTDHPHLYHPLRYAVRRMNVPLVGDDVRALVIAFARAGLAAGAVVAEHDDGTHAGVDVDFGPVGLHVYAAVHKVHPVTRRSVEQVDEGTRRIVEYTPRSILAELGGTTTDAAEHSADGMGAVA